MLSSPALTMDPDTIRLLRLAVSRSRRTRGVQFTTAFARSATGESPMLAKLLRGGRGGAVRLKLYLCITLIAASTPYDMKRPVPNETWARMIGLPDPFTKGARRVADALTWLERLKLLKLDRKPGRPPLIQLLSPTGDGTDYTRPASNYISIPLGLWEQGWLVHLSASAVALLDGMTRLGPRSQVVVGCHQAQA